MLQLCLIIYNYLHKYIFCWNLWNNCGVCDNCLLTNYHILDGDIEINILLNAYNEDKKIDVNIKRKMYYNKEYDTTKIELRKR